MRALKIRAHHAMCLAFFQGKGYSSSFTANMESVKNLLAQNPMVDVVKEADEICVCCPNLYDGVCRTQRKVSGYDRKVLNLCHITEGEPVRWETFKNRVRDNILTADKRESICGDCQWNDLCTSDKKM